MTVYTIIVQLIWKYKKATKRENGSKRKTVLMNDRIYSITYRVEDKSILLKNLDKSWKLKKQCLKMSYI